MKSHPIFYLLLQPLPHLPEHCFEYGQPIQVSPRFFARRKYISIATTITATTAMII